MTSLDQTTLTILGALNVGEAIAGGTLRLSAYLFINDVVV